MHGQTVCYMHGGASRRKGGAPKGSKNALKTGQYETILASTMNFPIATVWTSIL